MTPTLRRTLIWLPIVAVSYFVAARLGLLFAFVHPSATSLWAPSGIGLAAILVLGYSMWPAIFVAAFFVNNVTAGSELTSLGIAVGNTLECVAGAWLVNRFARGRRAFDRSADVLKFAAFAGLISTTVSPTSGVTSLALGGFAPWSDFMKIWHTWWLGDFVGVIIVTPIFVLLARSPRVRWDRVRVRDALLVLATLVLAVEAAFGGLVGRDYSLRFLCVIPLVWAAMRLGARETAAANLLLSLTALYYLATRGQLSDQPILSLQVFLTVPAVMALALAAAVAEREALQQSVVLGVERRSHDLMTRAEQLAHMGSWHWDVPSNSVTWSDELHRIFAVEPGTPLTLETFIARIDPHDRELVQRTLRGVVERPGAFQFSERIVRPSGELRTLECQGDVIIGPDGQLEALFGFCRDVTVERQAQAALAEREQRFAKLFHASPVAMSVSRLVDGQLVDVNQRWCDLTGYTREESIGHPKENLGLWPEPEQRAKIIAKLRAYGAVPEAEFLIRTRAGLLRRVLATVERIEIDRQDCMLLLILRT